MTCIVGQEKGIMFVFAKAMPVEEVDVFIQYRCVAGHGDISRNRVPKPDTIIRDAGTYTLPGMGQPPMLHVAFGELAGSGA